MENIQKDDMNAENMTDLVRIINAKGDIGEIKKIISENESLQNEKESSE
ncbi:hypothetical protein [Bacillus massilinigeriensis]|nr:hypothetical protein [Bacillus massilionigeriensis]